MQTLTPPLADGMDVIFLIYGAAFLALALAILVRYNDESNLELSRPLRLLAGFGLLHGVLEWTDLWKLIHGNTPFLEYGQPFILLVSYLFLFEFGRRLARSAQSQARAADAARRGFAGLLSPAIYLPLLLLVGVGASLSAQPLQTLGILTRYVFGFTGSVLAGTELLLNLRSASIPGLSPSETGKLIRAGRLGGGAFIAYGILGGLIVPTADWFPASLINYDSFRDVFGVPVQLARAASAVVIAVAIGTLLKAFRLETLARIQDAHAETRRALYQLETLHRNHALILASSGEGIVGFDASGLTTFVNATAEQLFGFRGDELLGRDLHGLTHHTLPNGMPYPHKACPIHLSLTDHMPRRGDDEIFWRKDGSSFPVDFVVTPMFEGRQVVGGVLCFRDTTEQMRLSRRRVSMQETLLRLAALPAVNEGDLDTMVRVVTERLARAFGVERVSVCLLDEAQTTLRCVDLFELAQARHSNGQEVTDPALTPYLAALKTSRYLAVGDVADDPRGAGLRDGYLQPLGIVSMLHCLIASGSRPFGILCLEEVGRPHGWAPDEIDFACQLADQTGLVLLNRERRQAEAASRAKSAFISNMSHELRTPMNAIIGLTGLALRKATDPRLIDQLGKIGKAAQHLLGVINNILDLSKIEADRLTMEQIDFRLGEVLENLVSLIGQRVAEKGLALQTDLPGEIANLPLKGDPLRLTQILLNLIGNALKFTTQGAVGVHVRLAEEGPDTVLLRFEVRDKGIGIAPEDAQRLFTAFEQAHDATYRKYGGTGLGLAISKRLALQMGDEIGVESAPGEGSTFWFTARLGKGCPAISGATAESRVSAEACLQAGYAGARVLLVEDEPVNQEVSLCLLEEAGLAVEVADDGEEAVTKARQTRYDLILMDMQMPKLSGVEATRSIRGASLNMDVPIVAMTANAFNEDRVACIDAGMNDHIGKPVDPDLLYETLLKWLSQARPADIPSIDP